MHERLRVMASDRYHAISAPPCPIPRTSLALQWAQSCSGRAAQGPSPHPCSGQHSRSSRSHTRRWLQGQAAGVEQGTADSHCNMAAEQTLSEHGMLVANHGCLSHPRVVILQHKGAESAGSGHNHERCCNVRLQTHVDEPTIALLTSAIPRRWLLMLMTLSTRLVMR